MPTVSVITPAYNVERYLDDSAQSVLQQTYADLELIIVDDGSTDRTPEVIDGIRRADPARVRSITVPNNGPSAARNAAMRLARGEFLALLDSDDIWERQFLARQMAVFAERPDVDLVSGNGRYLGSRWHGRPVGPWPDPRPPLTLATIISDERAVFVMTVFRRRVLEAIGGFNESLRGNEDFDFWLRAALAGFAFARNDEPLAWYRRRDDSLSSNGIGMLRGAIDVCRTWLPAFAARPERALMERQIAYYEAELDAALARHALATGDAAEAARALAALQSRRPSIRTAVAAALARHAAPVLAAMYQLKCAVRMQS
jgi:glycosyltransferase involved in cell wall biosynthesis